MLVSLDREVIEDLGVIIPDYFFWFYLPVFTVLKVVLSTYGPVYYWCPIVISLLCTRSLKACCSCWWYVPRSLHVSHKICIWDIARCGKSPVPLHWCWRPALELPGSESQYLLWCWFYWVIDMGGPSWQLLTHLSARRHAEAFYTRLQLYRAFFRWL